MENKIKNLEDLKILTEGYLNTLKPSGDEQETYTAEIKFLNYYELGATISNMLKLCILALDQDADEVTANQNSSINISFILKTALQLFPLDELELVSDIKQKLTANSKPSPTV